MSLDSRGILQGCAALVCQSMIVAALRVTVEQVHETSLAPALRSRAPSRQSGEHMTSFREPKTLASPSNQRLTASSTCTGLHMARGGPLVEPPAGLDPDEDAMREVFNFRITGPYRNSLY